MTVLGAGGFIGRALSARLAVRGVSARTLTRANAGTLGPATDWPKLLDGARTVIHLASRAHVRTNEPGWIAAEVATAAALSRAARQCGVARLVFMSSIKAMGETSGERGFRADTPPQPVDDYGRAKLAIEAALQDAPGLAILRPPLVYGPGVKANFRALLAAVARGLPLPLASIRNRRAFIFIDNLLDMVEALLAPDAPGGIYLMRDDDEVSTPELVRRIARSMARAPRLLPCPPGLLRAALRCVGRSEAAEALLGSLSIDDGATRALLGWRPRVSLDDGLAATCRWFKDAAA
ncbi:MAG TPA: NAD-dependent epimerase/dehydratase family protein [Stellaceae bacterium]|nr:NAD-dependent epimerase/dehydratase family protein [Stellaceae bacterium]